MTETDHIKPLLVKTDWNKWLGKPKSFFRRLMDCMHNLSYKEPVLLPTTLSPKQTKIFLPPNTERFFSWLLNEVLTDMGKTETSYSGLVVNICFKRNTCVWTAQYLMENNHLSGRWNNWWETLLCCLGAATCVLKESLFISSRCYFLQEKRIKRFLCQSQNLYSSTLSAAVCFVFVCKLRCFFPAGSCGGGGLKAASVGWMSLGALRGVARTLVPGPKY